MSDDLERIEYLKERIMCLKDEIDCLQDNLLNIQRDLAWDEEAAMMTTIEEIQQHKGEIEQKEHEIVLFQEDLDLLEKINGLVETDYSQIPKLPMMNIIQEEKK